MRDALKSYLALANGVTELTKQRAVTAAKQLVAQGEATASQVQELAEDLLQQSKQNREAVTALVRFEVDKALGRVGLATQDEVEALKAKVKALEAQLSGPKAPAAKAAAPKAPAKKAAAKKAPAKKTGA
ncbi:MAG: phasin family protein [Mycobacteriales bacterium]|nr:phasin family protein [Mycobacteriales bacterium]